MSDGSVGKARALEAREPNFDLQCRTMYEIKSGLLMLTCNPPDSKWKYRLLPIHLTCSSSRSLRGPVTYIKWDLPGNDS